MAKHNQLGTAGEDIAVKWLREKGYEILYRNWRHRQYEIDVIALKNKFLHIIEVKTRNHPSYGYPEESVGRRKFRNLQRAADQFLFLHPQYRWIQYNILAITWCNPEAPEFFLLEDVFL